MAPDDPLPFEAAAPVSRTRPPDTLVRAASFAWRVLAVLALVAAVVWLLAQIRVVVIPFALALVVAAVLVPATDFVERRARLPRGVAAAVVVVGVAGAFVASLVFLGAVVVGRFGEVGRALGQGVRDAGRFVVSLPLGVTQEEWSRALAEPLEAAGPGLADVANRVSEGARMVAEVGTEAGLMLAFAFFLAKDGRSLWDGILAEFPDDFAARVRDAAAAAWHTLSGYLFGVVVIGLANGAMFAIALLVLGVPLVVPLTLLTVIGSLIPFVGPIVSGALAAVVALSSGGLDLALLVVGAAILVQQIEGNLLQPYVMGRAIALHPIVVLGGVTAGIVLMGIPGAFLAVPILASGWAFRCRWRTNALAAQVRRVRE